MNKNLQSPTTLTEFAPLSPEPEDSPGLSYLFTKLFKRNNTSGETKQKPTTPTDVASTPEVPQESKWPDIPEFKEPPSNASSLSGIAEGGGAGGEQYRLGSGEGRSLPNVLKRISNLLALKSTGLQSYKDTELKQYWMPDSVSKECYDCGEKFTTFRRKHHCRVCGQIFCSRCCNQEIPGKIMGCTGDLRVCTYCGKVVLSYLQSADMGADLSSDLRALQEDLQTKFGSVETNLLPTVPTSQPSLALPVNERDEVKRKPSVGYQEEKFFQARSQGQPLLDPDFMEGDSLEAADFSLGGVSPSHTPPPPSSDELWPSDLDHDSTTARPHDSATTGTVFLLLTDSEPECAAAPNTLPSSASLFRLDLDLESSTVHISRPAPTPALVNSQAAKRAKTTGGAREVEGEGEGLVRAMVQSFKERARQPSTAINWHNITPQCLRGDNGDRQAYSTLSVGFQQHLGMLVKQLLLSEGLAQSWAQTVRPLAEEVIDTIRPNLRSDCDDIDIRQYVQIKKVAGGVRSDCCIVSGVVCRKNLAHRAMPTRLTNPRVLLLSCAIVYQRVEGRLMSLEPVIMQEHEYLRHTVARIAAMAPDLVMVQRNVSRLAQESLLRLGISLVLNVKPSVLERVARVTGADIVKSIDAQVGRPQLGTCSSFYVKTFTEESGAAKTLMFLEGCTFPHLGCTVLLRGASVAELAKLKRVTGWLIYALYNWRLELSFLMDEFAKPPSLEDDNFFHDEENKTEKTSSTPLGDSDFLNTIPTAFDRTKSTDTEISQNQLNIRRMKSVDKENIDEVLTVTSSEGKVETTIRTKLSVKDKSVSEERKMNVESVSDFSDPLHLYLNLDDEVFSEVTNGQSLSVSEPHQSNRFRKALDDTILSVSPFLNFSVPYLETENGRNCLLRRYFPEQIYWTAQLQEKTLSARVPPNEPSNKDALLKLNGVKLKPVHPFITAKITEPVNSDEVQTMLALYRACGGRLPLPSTDRAPTAVPPTPAPPAALPPPAILDALDPANHQRLAVLFCSYSHESPNAPAFCVNPWVVHMDYYGRNDIPLGAFLERYCFRDSYVCPSERCSTPMLKHVRRFVHGGGAVQISLREIEGAPRTEDESILMWTYCPACNQQVSQVMPMSADSWAFSFAKYLELHFHGGVYSVRGSDCTHSLHQTCRQFFGHKNMVAYFQYDKISVWEISLPPQLLVMQPTNRAVQENEILEEVKRWALNGYEVFSAVLNQLCTLASNGDVSAMTMKQQLQKEQALFKGRVEEIQMRLTSPSHSEPVVKDVNPSSLWHLEDSLVLLKRSIAGVVTDWNTRLAEAEATNLARRRDEKNKKTGLDNKAMANPLSEIIDGVLTAQVYDVEGGVVAGGGVRRSLPSQPSQHSLHSAADVMDLDDSRNTLGDESVFTGDSSDPDNETKMATKDAASVVPVVLRNSSSVEPVAASEEVHEQTLMDHDVHQIEEEVDMNATNRGESHSAKQLTDRVSVKQILSQLLPKDTPAHTLQCPMSPQEHHTLPLGSTVPVIVYEREPSSIIAYAISSHDYWLGLEQLRLRRTASTCEQHSPSPLMKRKSLDAKDLVGDPTSGVDTRKSSVLSFLRQTSSGSVQGGSNNEAATTPTESVPEEITKTDVESSKSKTNKDKHHLEVQFSDSSATFSVKIYYAEEFARLRATIFPAGEEAFVRSLSRCVQWAARGGKSGSNFAKTNDDRFILKEMSRTETHPFMDSAPQYFDYMERCVATGSPTLLGKIVGVYRVTYRSTTSNTTIRNNLLVMENLFYGRSVKHKFDLKGSLRNRLVNPLDQSGEIVLLDENLINMTCDNPLYILPHSKTVLMQAIQSDTQFLASQMVMDYSLLVGLDETNKELVVGIIDYIRTFTWDKRLETMVKKTGLLGGQGKLPTIVSPDEYRDRFINAMHRYFLPVPDSWTGLGKGLDF